MMKALTPLDLSLAKITRLLPPLLSYRPHFEGLLINTGGRL